jgi:NAD(P)-dependent dehydrogenase (short-subunit alcohol dehydrogenase family)
MMLPTLENRSAIITGANQGLGLEIARQYVLAGANVMLCARNQEMLEQARVEISLLARPGQRVLARPADISNGREVESLVEETVDAFGSLQILVNNAGIYGPKGEIESVDWEDWVRAIEINLYGSVLMCRAVLPHFKTKGYGKIVQLSGGGATNPMPRLTAYAVSKAAVIRFAESLAEEVRGAGIDVNAIAPGALNTRMLEEVLAAGPEKVGQSFYDRALKQKDSGGAPMARGAELAVFLGSAASDGITAKLISSIWDNWESWPDHIEELSKSDAYTLRRIAGRDRGLTWGDK